MKLRVFGIALLIMFLSSACTVAEPGSDDMPPLSEEAEQLPELEPAPEEPPVSEVITIKGKEYSMTMTELHLSYEELTSADIEPLAYMTNLTYLSLNTNQVSDVGALLGLANLTVIDIRSNPIDREQYERLKAALPDCLIIFGPLPDMDLPTETFTDQNGFVWTIKPQHDYDRIHYCECRRYFYKPPDIGDFILSPLTGAMIDSTDDSHCRSNVLWIYDPALDLLGYIFASMDGNPLLLFPKSDFASRFPDWTHCFLPVRRADSTKITPYDDTEGPTGYIAPYLHYQDAFLDELHAIAYGGQWLSDFSYKSGEIDPWLQSTYSYYDIELYDQETIAVCQDGRWGVLDKAGYTVIPFVFEHIVSIDGTTVFAKLDGLYGILDIPATMANFT